MEGSTMRAKEFIVEDHTFADTGNAWENGKKDAMNFRPKNVEKYHLRHKYRSHYSDGYNVGLKRRDRSINPETGKPYIKFGPNGPITPGQGVAEGQENFNGIDISMEIQKDDEYVDDEDYDNQVIYVTASSNGKELGHVLFAFDGEYLMPQDLEVEERYRGQGIAQTMYDYVKSKGYKIRRSGQQTDAGTGFWDKHKPGKNVWEQGVAEGTDPDKKYTIKKSYTMSKAGVEKAVWYIMDGDFVVDVTDLRRDAKYYADKWNAAEKESSNASQNPHKPAVAEGSQTECPPATQDITLNLKNRQKAIDEYGYGPLNPDMPNTKFWMKKVDEWNLDSAEEAKQSLCGNCAAFDQRQHTLDCIAQGIDSDNPEDAEGIIDAGELGYCKFLKFKCASRRTCDAWVTGGPLVDKQRDSGR
jgi:GNAT superfamily N-acetyltransferase